MSNFYGHQDEKPKFVEEKNITLADKVSLLCLFRLSFQNADILK